ncbi:MAG: MOSC domain-containing protein [Gammaproteobacteria bacterium]|nr:MOSC domain-containing protein [Gammaproteobacteria bacterium]
MMKVGTIREIWRYPVKGMAGEQVQQCAITASGLAGDRVWALRDVARQEIQSCKFRPELLTCTASSRPQPAGHHVDISFPDGTIMGSDEAAIHQRLSELVGHASTIEVLQPIAELDFYRRHKRDDHTWLEELKATFTREPGEPLPDFTQFSQEAKDFVTVPGTFFLVTPFHLITSATLRHMKKLLPQADWDVRRFRPNIVVDTNHGDEGLVEQDWIGRQLTIAETQIDCTATAPRCGAVTRGQQGLDFDTSMLRTIVKDADQNLGIYGSIRQPGVLRVGDTVYIN